jgi:hypothetical protein
LSALTTETRSSPKIKKMLWGTRQAEYLPRNNEA